MDDDENPQGEDPRQELCDWYGWDASFWAGPSLASVPAVEHKGPPARRGAEVFLKAQSSDERRLFDISDIKEWQSIASSGAVRVVPAPEAHLIMRRCPDRILRSRMVRRFKPQEGLGAARWCVQGHQDPDGGSSRFTPRPRRARA